MAVGVSQFPTALDTNNTLIEAANHPTLTTTTAGMTAVQTTVPVETTSGYAASGTATIQSSLGTEVIYYAEKTATQFGTVANPVQRAREGTTAYAHPAGAEVQHLLTAQHHNVHTTAIIAAQKKLGYGGAVQPPSPASNTAVVLKATTGGGQSDWLALTAAEIGTALGYTPVNKAGDTGVGAITMTGALTLPSNGLVLGTTQVVAANGFLGLGTASPESSLHVKASTRPTITVEHGSAAARGRLLSAAADNLHITQNASYNGATWDLDDTAKGGVVLQLASTAGSNDSFNVYFASPGANPRTVAIAMRVEANGTGGLNTTSPTAMWTIVGLAQPASVGTATGTAATDTLLISGGTGGNTTIATTGTGGTGADFTWTGGTGGQSTAGATANTGGRGGTFTITGGAGGGSTFVSGAAVNTGGAGGDISINGGNGGAASGGATNLGGDGGSVYVVGGVGTGGGANGNVNLAVSSAAAVRGFVGVRLTDPQAPLEILGPSVTAGVGASHIRLRSARVSVTANHVLGQISVISNDGQIATPSTAESARIACIASNSHTDTSYSASWVFYTTNVTTASEVLRLTEDNRLAFNRQATQTAFMHFEMPSGAAGASGTTRGLAHFVAGTYTDSSTAASGTAAAWAVMTIAGFTLAASNATVTTTDAASFYVANSPAAGTNMTITRPWAVWVDAGNVRFDSNVVCGDLAANATNAVGPFLYITTSAGPPTGTPTGFTGKVAIHYDTTNNRIYVYNGAWRMVAVA